MIKLVRKDDIQDIEMNYVVCSSVPSTVPIDVRRALRDTHRVASYEEFPAALCGSWVKDALFEISNEFCDYKYDVLLVLDDN